MDDLRATGQNTVIHRQLLRSRDEGTGPSLTLPVNGHAPLCRSYGGSRPSPGFGSLGHKPSLEG